MTGFDVEELKKKAEASPHGEAFEILNQSSEARLGVGVSSKPSDLFLEVTLRVFDEGVVDVDVLERRIRAVRALVGEGFTVRSEDDVGVTCEKSLPESGVSVEAAKLWGLLNSHSENRPR